MISRREINNPWVRRKREGIRKGPWSNSASKAIGMIILILSEHWSYCKNEKGSRIRPICSWDCNFSFTSRCQFNSRALNQYFLMIISSRKRRKSLLGKAAMMSPTSSETCTAVPVSIRLVSDLQAVLKIILCRVLGIMKTSHLPVDWYDVLLHY